MRNQALNNNKEILEIAHNAKEDLLVRLYIAITEDLKVIVADKDKQKDKNTEQYIFLSGMTKGYFDILEKMEIVVQELEDKQN